MSTANPTAEKETAAQEFLSGKLTHVDVAKIEKELKQLWQQAAADGSQTTMTRACSFNIVLASSDDEPESICNDLLDDVLVHRPGRGILAIYRPDKPHRLDAWVSARCHLEGGKKQICAEQITVCCEGGKPRELSSVVLPLVIADLPVFLYWRGRLHDEENFNVLAECSNRLIIDSLREPFNHDQVRAAGKIVQSRHDSLFVSDLNWRRLSGWMRAFADAFDGFPMPGSYLWKIRKLTVASVTDGAPSGSDPANVKRGLSTQSLLLIAWLASRLGWTLTHKLVDGTTTMEFHARDGAPISVIFTSGQGQDTGHIVSADCEFEDGQMLSVASQKSEELSYVIAQAKGIDHKEATRADYDLTEAMLLEQELSNLQRYPIYEAAVHMAAAMVS